MKPFVMRVALVDDRQAVRAGIKQMLMSYFDIQTLEIAERFPEALDRIAALRPDVVILGEAQRDQELSCVIRQLSTFGEAVGCRTLVMRDVTKQSEAAQIIAAGAHGYLPSNASEQQFASAVVIVATGGQVQLPRLAIGNSRPARAELAPDSAGLTEREFSVLSALGRGLSNSEIARELVVSEATVKKHLSSVMQKVGQRDRLRAGLYAYRNGLGLAARRVQVP